jgi:hypothetical protein
MQLYLKIELKTIQVKRPGTSGSFFSEFNNLPADNVPCQRTEERQQNDNHYPEYLFLHRRFAVPYIQDGHNINYKDYQKP